MSIYAPLRHVHQSRTIKPRYARTQATPQAVTLDPAYDVTKGDIFPGSVLTRLGDDRVTLCDGNTVPAGLSGNWHAPVFGLDEVGTDGNWDMSMWVLGNDAQMEVYAPAFDTAAPWALAEAELDKGKAVYLTSTADGLLTIQSESPRAAAIAALPPVGTGKVVLSKFFYDKADAIKFINEAKDPSKDPTTEEDCGNDDVMVIVLKDGAIKIGDHICVDFTDPKGKTFQTAVEEITSDGNKILYYEFPYAEGWKDSSAKDVEEGVYKMTVSTCDAGGDNKVTLGTTSTRATKLNGSTEFIQKPNELTAAKLVRRLGTTGIVVSGL